MFLNILWIIFWGGFVQMTILLAVIKRFVQAQPKQEQSLARLIRLMSLIKQGSLHITVFYLVFFLLILPLVSMGIVGLIFALYQFQMIPPVLMQEATWDSLFDFVIHLWYSQWQNLLYLPMLLIALKQAVKWWKVQCGEGEQSKAGVVRSQGYPKSVAVICAIAGIILFLIYQFMGSWSTAQIPHYSTAESEIQTRALFLGDR